MKHSFKIKHGDNNSVTIILKIKLSDKDQRRIFSNSNYSECQSYKDLKKGYKKYGLEWLLHLIRLYISFGKFSKKKVMSK